MSFGSSFHARIVDGKKEFWKRYRFGCYLSFEDYMMLFLVLEEARGQRDNQEQGHEVFYKRDCFDGF